MFCGLFVFCGAKSSHAHGLCTTLGLLLVFFKELSGANIEPRPSAYKAFTQPIELSFKWYRMHGKF